MVDCKSQKVVKMKEKHVIKINNKKKIRMQLNISEFVT